MAQYRIVRITDRDGNEKNIHNRVGRIMNLDPEKIIKDSSLLMECVNPGSWKSLITSPVESWSYMIDGLQIVTMKSVYELAEVVEDASKR